MIEIKGKYTTADIKTDFVEDTCLKQLQDMADNEAFTNPIKVMPDCHAGNGSCIGFTMKLGDKLSPAVVGVDIGCGVTAVNLGKIEGLDLPSVERTIRETIPMGFRVRNDDAYNFKDEFPWENVNATIREFIGSDFKYFDYDFFINDFIKKIGCKKDTAENSIGTLGGGNHFIELGKDEAGDIWLTVHSGSRNLGQRVCNYHDNIANKGDKEKADIAIKQGVADIKENNPSSNWEQKIKELRDNKETPKGYLEGQELKDYLIDMVFAQVYAKWNRITILEVITKKLKWTGNIKDLISSTHNHIDFKDRIIRKGAISAYEDEQVVIPWNMRDGIVIGVGKSNADWNYSAPHGAGRVLSRTKAKATLDMNVFKEQMKGIYSTSVCESTLDEAPDAYKDYKLIEKAMSDTVEITHRIKPLINLKDK